MANQPKKYTKFVATAATATLVASAIVPVASAAGFSDVADTNSHVENINQLVEAGIIKGFEDGTFKPGQELTRGQVVKMLGKWVEAQGVTAPADFATKARFTDLAVDAKDQELVKYAALVADAKVFNGSNGVLNASGKISRENMALVLDRAFAAINGTSLVELASTIEDVKVADLATAKKEAQEAIQALRDLGISGVENFNPKGNVTRGQFASFLNKTIKTEAKAVELTVKSAVATSANTLEVVLSDDSKHEVKLEKALEANKATEVTFTIGEKEYTAEVTYAVTVKEAKVLNASTLEVVLSDDTKHVVTLTSPLEANKATAVSFKINDFEYSATVTYVVTDLAVSSVKTNGSTEVVVTFNKAIDSSIVVENKLVAGVITIDGVDAKDLVATLSTDKTTLTLTGVQAVGVHKLNIAADKIQTKAGEKLAAFEEAFRVAEDTVRPEVTSIENTSKYVFEVQFSKPVTEASAKAVVASYTNKEVEETLTAPTAALSADGKTLTLTFANTTVANEEIKLAFAALKDLAGNTAAPIAKTVKVSDADKTKPAVTAVKSISTTEMQVQFSEKLASTVVAANVTFNGAAVKSATVNKKDATVLDVELTAPTTTAGSLVIAKGAVEDLSGNKNADFTQTVYFTADKVAPTLVSSKVESASGVNTLVLTMSEEVSTKTLPATIDFKYVDKFGVTQTVKVDKANLSVDADDKTKVEIVLPAAIEVDGKYTVEFAKEMFADAFANVNEKFAVSFENKPLATTSNKLELVKGSEVADAAKADRVKEGKAYLLVNFAKGVDVASVTNKANYAVEGATVESVELVSNSLTGAQVKVFITDETVELTGNYNVTVSGVKGYESSVTVMDAKTVNVAIVENVAPVVEKAFVKDATNVELTFSENVELDDATDFEFFVDGEEVKGAVKATSTTTKVVTVTVQDADIYKLLAAGKKVELRASSTIDLSDEQGNITSFKAITLK